MSTSFAQTCCHKLSGADAIITATTRSQKSNAFGKASISSTENVSHVWKIKISQNAEQCGIRIGIIKQGHGSDNEVFTKSGFAYGICSCGDIYSANCMNSSYKLNNAKQKFITNDIILMKLDLISKRLSFINSGSEQSIKIENIKTGKDITYKIAIYLPVIEDSVQILHYDKIHKDEEIEQKEKIPVKKDYGKVFGSIGSKLFTKMNSISVFNLSNTDESTSLKERLSEAMKSNLEQENTIKTMLQQMQQLHAENQKLRQDLYLATNDNEVCTVCSLFEYIGNVSNVSYVFYDIQIVPLSW